MTRLRFDAVVMVGLTYALAALAFVLSYSKLTELAGRGGYSPVMALLWPLIVDGLAVAATVGVMRMRSRGYAWCLLLAGTGVSVIAAVATALLPGEQPPPGALPPLASAAVSVVPPLFLLAIPHLAVKLQRELAAEGAHLAPTANSQPTPEPARSATAKSAPAKEPAKSTAETVMSQPSNAPAKSTPDVAPSSAPADRAVRTASDLHASHVAPAKGDWNSQPHVEAEDVARTSQLHLVPREAAQPEVLSVKPPTAAKYTPEQIAEALALVAAGVSQREAGRQIGASGNAVRGWVAKAQAG
ncbi:DUF2637 domain-containing protein [Rhodococcus marinonascens]|uniref:DUF2637 domain-containing protein n=1 Tax=Rhodococcus marinonascens TaxID=38311 RepID=UPI00093325D0|nr:DUF2637 domain-containing protein [Rhodococcus marinonascens]